MQESQQQSVFHATDTAGRQREALKPSKLYDYHDALRCDSTILDGACMVWI